jgi:very-short-patch-repair endonuclease
MARRVDLDLTQRARSLRANATSDERKMWRLLSRFEPKFTRQLPIGPYIADLACREARLVVEIDGGQHADSTRDVRRDDHLRSEGWTVFHVWNSDVRENPLGTAEAILAKAAECLGGTHPQPLPSREGRVRRPRYE